jgi:hypothetical protein
VGNLNKLKETGFQILNHQKGEEMSILSTYYMSGALISFYLHYEVGTANCTRQIRTLIQRGWTICPLYTAESGEQRQKVQ